jgi:hypothetical protein
MFFLKTKAHRHNCPRTILYNITDETKHGFALKSNELIDIPGII